ncbi:MAG: tetratricopeptide repeat protein, partial [Acidobacteriota bacterium]
LAEAIETYAAPLADDPAAEGADRTFADDAARRAAATEAVAAVEGGMAGDIARLYEADIALADGDTARAREAWEGFLREHDDHILAATVELNLIALDRAEGQGEDVVARLERALNNPARTLPEDAVLYELGVTLEALGRDDEAMPHFQRLVDDFPSSPYITEASRRVSADAPTLPA